MQLLRPLLLDIIPTVQQTAALALGRLANYSDDMAEAVVKSDILPQLIYSLGEWLFLWSQSNVKFSRAKSFLQEGRRFCSPGCCKALAGVGPVCGWLWLPRRTGHLPRGVRPRCQGGRRLGTRLHCTTQWWSRSGCCWRWSRPNFGSLNSGRQPKSKKSCQHEITFRNQSYRWNALPHRLFLTFASTPPSSPRPLSTLAPSLTWPRWSSIQTHSWRRRCFHALNKFQSTGQSKIVLTIFLLLYRIQNWESF